QDPLARYSGHGMCLHRGSAQTATTAVISPADNRWPARPIRLAPLESLWLACNDRGGPRVSHFFAYLARMRFVKRWGLMRNTHVENLQEHSLQVAMLAHALAVIRNTLYGGTVRAERAATLGLYHDAAEVITGDIVAPIKHFNP